jgi:hypothetical protein
MSFVIGRCYKDFSEEAKFHSLIHSICMACTCPSHVRSLVGEGILRYWEGVLGSKINEDRDELSYVKRFERKSLI